MIEQILGKSNTHSLKLFSKEEIDWLEKRVFARTTKKGDEFAVKCIVREKDIRLTPEEVVRQIYAHRLIDGYGYPVSRLAFEFPVFFGRETKRADIVVRDKDDLNVPYIIDNRTAAQTGGCKFRYYPIFPHTYRASQGKRAPCFYSLQAF